MTDIHNCFVCTYPIDGEDPHTYHAEDCPRRVDTDMGECSGDDGCDEDCHEACCPSCHPPEMKLSWNQPCCEVCWFEIRGVWMMSILGGRHEEHLVSVTMPIRTLEPELERCAYCGAPTIFGVYRRQDPATVPYPKKEPI